MRGAETFDGKMSGNRQMVDRYNETKKGKKKQRPHETGGESGGAHEASGHDEIKQVVAEHGPASSHHIFDRGEGHEEGRYHVTTRHEDGHVHHADHETLEDAHAHAAHAHEDTAHLGDMPMEDEQIADQQENVEDFPSRKTRNVGLLS